MKKGVDGIGISVCTYCHDGAGNYLISKRGQGCRDEQGRWEPAGGGSLELGEYVEEALRREIKEEVCADVLDYEFLGFRDVHREHEGVKTHWIALDFKVLINRDQVNIGEPELCDELRWVTFDSVPEPRHSQFSVFLEKYKNKF